MLNLLKRVVPQIVVLVIICVIVLLSYFKTEIINVNTEPNTYKTIIIDAGHGGFDGGASAADGTVEKDINLKISKNVCDILRLNGFKVIMTRESDTGTEDDPSDTIIRRKKSDLSNRLKIMQENPDGIFVSIHLNKFTTSAARGAQVFYSKNYTQSYNLANNVQESIKTLIQPDNTRVVKQGTDSTYLLKNAVVPAIIVECGFLSNNTDLEQLKNAEYQSKMAFAISKGILDFYNIK